MADDMVKLLDALHLARVDIVGWSDGGIIGLEIAMHHPERIRRLVVIGANYDVDGLRQLPAPSGGPPRSEFHRRNAPDPTPSTVLYQKVTTMWRTQPHYTLDDLHQIKAPTLRHGWRIRRCPARAHRSTRRSHPGRREGRHRWRHAFRIVREARRR